MDETEVTNAQFQAFLIENSQWQRGQIDLRFAKADYVKHWNRNNYPSGKGNHPVVNVSWYAAMAYSEWAGKRLPTKAKWERAARGGLSGKKYPHGNTITERDANYGNNVKGTTLVRSYSANGYGLYDMAGNVWEWCLDAYYKTSYSMLPWYSAARNPFSHVNGVQWLLDTPIVVNSSRVIRGGDWNNPARNVWCAHRHYVTPEYPVDSIGFRCLTPVTSED